MTSGFFGDLPSPTASVRNGFHVTAGAATKQRSVTYPTRSCPCAKSGRNSISRAAIVLIVSARGSSCAMRTKICHARACASHSPKRRPVAARAASRRATRSANICMPAGGAAPSGVGERPTPARDGTAGRCPCSPGERDALDVVADDGVLHHVARERQLAIGSADVAGEDEQEEKQSELFHAAQHASRGRRLA